MVSAVTGIAVSGLQAAGKRLENSANNLANQLTTSEATGRAFEPQDIVQISEAAGGVRTEAVARNPATVALPDADSATGTVQAPNVNEAEELINQQIAASDFQANLASLKAQDKMEKSLLDIIA